MCAEMLLLGTGEKIKTSVRIMCVKKKHIHINELMKMRKDLFSDVLKACGDASSIKYDEIHRLCV